VSEWVYFIHPPRDDFAATMTAEEQAVWGVHFERFERMHSRSLRDRRPRAVTLTLSSNLDRWGPRAGRSAATMCRP